MAYYTGAYGTIYNLGNQIGSGGEGIVYAIQGSNDKVAKLYKADKLANKMLRDAKERKLKAMMGMNIKYTIDGVLRLAWPIDVLYNQGQMVGFVMPKLSKMLKIFDIQRCWRPDANNPSTKEVLAVYPNYTWKYAVQFAYNLAWVVRYVHSNGIVIGDLNQNNIYADTSTGAVVLIDCDSFDITDRKTGERFPCEVGLPEMLAPELQTVGQLKGKFTTHTDNFSLAIHIFRLLMRNADPFTGVPSAGASSSAIINANVNIINGNCPYVRNCSVSVPGWAPDFSILPLSVQNLFKKTFDYNATNAISKSSKRATAAEWCNVLAPLAAPEPNPNLKKCTNSQNKLHIYHVYSAHNTTCPWCKCEGYVPPKPQLLKSQSQAKSTTGYTTSVIKKGNTSNTSSSAAASGRNQIVRRTPYLFYIVLIACGIASGFIFENIASQTISETVGSYLKPMTCAIILAVVGAIGGAIMAHHFENKYIYAVNAIPWLLLGVVAIFIPPAVAVVVGVVIYAVILIVGLILSIVAIIVGIAVVCACLSGS